MAQHKYFYFSFNVCLLTRYKFNKNTNPPEYLMVIYVLYQLLIIIGYSILLSRIKIGYEALDVFLVDKKYSVCISDKDLILDNIHEFWVDIG